MPSLRTRASPPSPLPIYTSIFREKFISENLTPITNDFHKNDSMTINIPSFFLSAVYGAHILGAVHRSDWHGKITVPVRPLK